MTIDEAIKHCEEVAEENEKNAKSINNIYKKSCLECASEHRQLAEWLKELKALRRNVIDMCNDCDTCKYADVYPDYSPCVNCSHRYANQYEYDETREVNADEDNN